MNSGQGIAQDSGGDNYTTDERLAALSPGLSTELFHDVVLAAYDPYVNSLSGFQPSNGKSTVLQIHTTDFLRGRLCDMGWEKSDLHQVPCVIDREHGIRLCCSTDGGTAVGRKDSNPVLRTKGLGTLHIAGCGGGLTPPFPEMQYLLPEVIINKLDSLKFYYLLMHIDELKNEIRMEVSNPVFDERGDVSKWEDCIILSPLVLTSEPLVTTPEVPKPEISVKKRRTS